MKRKKLLSLFLILALCVGLAACTADVNTDVDTEIRLPDNLTTTATQVETTTTTLRYKTQGTTAAPTTLATAPPTTSRPIQKTSVTITDPPTMVTKAPTKAPTTVTAPPVTTTKPTLPPIDEDGIFDSKEDVALYVHTYGKLPQNYVTKSQYNKSDRYQCVGGDRFYNREGRLPGGEIYYECDIDTYGITSRGAKRLVWTKSGIVYYTGDHYVTFIQLYEER